MANKNGKQIGYREKKNKVRLRVTDGHKQLFPEMVEWMGVERSVRFKCGNWEP